MKLLEGTLELDGGKLLYHIVLLDKCIYLYMGTSVPTFSNLVYAIQTQFDEHPTPATLISAGEDDEFPERLAEKISHFFFALKQMQTQKNEIGLKLKIPVAISINVPASDPMSEAKLSQIIFTKIIPIITASSVSA